MEKGDGAQKLFSKIMAKTFFNLAKDITYRSKKLSKFQ